MEASSFPTENTDVLMQTADRRKKESMGIPDRKIKMEEGFYFHRNNVYFGQYDERQVSGGGRISAVKPEWIQTDRPFAEDQWAVRLWDNHRLLEPEYTDLQTMLLKMRTVMGIAGEREVDFSAAEERLGVKLPGELKLIYTAIDGHEEYFAGKEFFLPLDEIYVEQGIVVFYRKKRAPVAGYDTGSGCLARYGKRQWSVEQGDCCCYQFCAGRMLTAALENKPAVRTGRCKGRLVTTLNIERELEKLCDEKYRLLPELHIYGIAVMYSEDKLIAWIRSNGFYADIHAGAECETHLEMLGRHLGEVAWK